MLAALTVFAVVAIAIGISGLIVTPGPASPALADGAAAPAGPAASAAPEPTGPSEPPPRSPEDPAMPPAEGFTALGVAVYDRTEERLALSHRPDAEFTSASLVKLLIAFEALEGGEPADRVRVMLAQSHDAIAGEFWVAYGGTAIVTRWADRLGLAATRPPGSPNRWGDTILTAEDVVRIYRYLLDEAPGRIREPVLGALRTTTNFGADGFDQYFGVPYAAGRTRWAAKQGWSCCRWDRVLHTTGLLGAGDRFITVVLTAGPVGESWTAAAERLTGLVSRIMRAIRV